MEDPETIDEEDFAGLFTTKRVSRVQQQRDEEARIAAELAARLQKKRGAAVPKEKKKAPGTGWIGYRPQ